MRKRTRILIWIMCFLWIILLLWLSSENGPATARTSGQLAELIVRLFGLQNNKLSQVDHFLRILAHFGGFFVLGGLAYSASRLTWPKASRVSFYVFLNCGVFAILDEVKKIFITGRHLSWTEAGLNVIGVCFGVMIAKALICLFTHRD